MIYRFSNNDFYLLFVTTILLFYYNDLSGLYQRFCNDFIHFLCQWFYYFITMIIRFSINDFLYQWFQIFLSMIFDFVTMIIRFSSNDFLYQWFGSLLAMILLSKSLITMMFFYINLYNDFWFFCTNDLCVFVSMIPNSLVAMIKSLLATIQIIGRK